jgi:hypothetical protein
MSGAATVMPWVALAILGNQYFARQGWSTANGDDRSPTDIGFNGSVAVRLGQALGGSALADVLGGAIHTRLFGRRAPTVRNAETTFGFGGDELTGQTSARIQEEGGIFRSDRWTSRTGTLDAEALSGLQDVFVQLEMSVEAWAERMRSSAPDLIDASLRVVEEFDKKGKLKATQYFVDVLGRSFEAATPEEAQTRIFAENLLHTIDASLGTTVPAIAAAVSNPIADGIREGIGLVDRGEMRDRVAEIFSDIVPRDAAGLQGEASAIAERWRNDANLLMEGAQFLLVVATDLRAGFDLLGSGTLTPIVELVEELATSGESLDAAYTRISISTKLFQDALQLMGLELKKTQEQIVRFAVDITAAAGGIEAAGALWSNYFSRFYSESERAALALDNVTTTATAAFSSIGLTLGDFTDSEGLQRFRHMFEQVLPTLTAEQVVQWLRAGEALGLVTDAQAAYNAILERAAQTTVETVVVMSAAMEEAARLAGLVGDLIEGDRFGGGPGGLPGPGPRDANYGGTAPDWLLAIEAWLTGNNTPDPVDPTPGIPSYDPPSIVDDLDREIQRRYEMEMDWIRRLLALRDSLLLDRDLTTLTSEQRLAEAQAQYRAAFLAAQSGDEAARANFESIARTYAEELRAMYGSTDAYTFGFAAILADIQTLLAAANVRAGNDPGPGQGGVPGVNPGGGSTGATLGPAPIVDSINGLRLDTRNGFEDVVVQQKQTQNRVTLVERAVRDLISAIRAGSDGGRPRAL